MRTNRCDPLGARVLDLDRQPAVGMTGPGFGFNGFAGQGERHKDRSIRRVGDAIAPPASRAIVRRSTMACDSGHEPPASSITAPPAGVHAR